MHKKTEKLKSELGSFVNIIVFMLAMSPSCVAYNRASKSAVLMLDIDTATHIFLCPPTLQCCA